MRKAGELIGVGVIGLGVGEQHARAFHAHPACEVRVLCDFDFERARRLAAEFPGCTVAVGLEEMISDPRLDVLAIATFDDAHYEQVLSALRAGKHVFVEKPVCRTLAELAAVKARWRAHGCRLKLRSNLVLRAAPLYVRLREMIQDGELGRIYAFDGDYFYGRHHKIAEGWRKDVPDYSVMEGGGIHLVDLMLWLTGERPIAVSSAGNRICSEGTAFRYNDFISSTLEFDSGIIARISANFGCVHRHQHVVRIFGTRATFLYDDQGPRIHQSRDPARPAEFLADAPLPVHKGDLIPDFVFAELNGADDSAQTQGFFDGVSICIAADLAVATGNKERIEYI